MKNTQKDRYYSKLMRFLKELNARNPQRIDVYENRRTELMKNTALRMMTGIKPLSWLSPNSILVISGNILTVEMTRRLKNGNMTIIVIMKKRI